MMKPDSAAPFQRRRLPILDRLARRAVTASLKSLRRGEIVVRDSEQTARYGEPADLQTTIRVIRPQFFRQTLSGGTLSVADSYIHGDWDCDDLTSLFRIFIRNADTTGRLDSVLTRLTGLWHRLFHWCRDNSLSGSRQNIAAHYDLGNDFYRLWLDETWAYSSGIFATPQATLREASEEKFDRVCRKLQLQQSDHLLEIGTGWGGFALHAAGNYGCRVTTTTISAAQYEVACQRIREAGLADRVQCQQADYRQLQGKFNKLASIEMIEAVGYRHYDQYFSQCGQLLRPDGSLVIQAIVMPERRYARYLRSVDFIQRRVFPGGCLPSVSAMLESVGRTTDMRFVHAEDFGPHYAETLRRWRAAFQDRLEEVRGLGYSEEFIRLWNYYLCYCEAAFEERYIGVVQIQFDKPGCRRDPAQISKLAGSASSSRHSEGRMHSTCLGNGV